MNNWILEYTGLDEANEGLREALCTLGNGQIATRGAAEESNADGIHYPGTYLAGGYNRLKTEVSGKVIENEDLVNWPNWLCLTFKMEDEDDWFDLSQKKVLHYKQTLDIKHGLLIREMIFSDNKDRETSIISTRFVSMNDQHKAAIRWEFKAINWSGNIVVRTSLDGNIKNEGVKRYQKLNNEHINIIALGQFDKDNIYLLVQTNQSRIYMAQASSCHVFQDNEKVNFHYEIDKIKGKIIQNIYLNVTQAKETIIEKTVAIYSSKDIAISEPLVEAKNSINKKETFNELLKNHQYSWNVLWDRFDVYFSDPGNTILLLHLHIFHLLQTCSPHTIGMDVGVPARGLHGEAYRGHIFWDELFIFPLLNFRLPDLTQSLLKYRFHRLDAAKRLAIKEGFQGAMYPWQSGSNGREESQILHLNPNSGKWGPDNTYLQRHVNLAIAYNIWQYYEVTGNIPFMKIYGAEMLLEIAIFFSSICTWNSHKERYEILKVVGPDEFHTSYPDSEEPGINNNAYTNYMTSWLFTKAIKILKLIGNARRAELLQKLDLNEKTISKWDEISHKLFIPFMENGIIAQFEGYEKLKEFDWNGYRKKYKNIQRLDRILNAENDSVNNYKASKQADVLMLFYLFSSEELIESFGKLGYDFTPKYIPNNIDYYIPRTSDGSTLSRIVRSWVEARSKREQSWYFFHEALMSDFRDIQGGTTAEGIHLGSMASTVDIIQRCYTGLVIRNDILWLNPSFPKEIESMDLTLYYRGLWLKIYFHKKECKIEASDGALQPITIGFKDDKILLKPGATIIIPIHR